MLIWYNISIFLFLSSLILAVFLAGAVLILGLSFSMKMVGDREKTSPFECGFNPKFISRIPFSMRFFLVAIIFLVFDVEIVLLFPFLSSLMMNNVLISKVYLNLFVLVLLGGLYHEINEGSVDWAS